MVRSNSYLFIARNPFTTTTIHTELAGDKKKSTERLSASDSTNQGISSPPSQDSSHPVASCLWILVLVPFVFFSF